MLPFVTGAIAVALVFLPDAQPNGAANQANAKTVEVKRVKKSTEALQKKIKKKSSELEEKNLKEASKLAKELEKGLEQIKSKDGDKKEALVGMKNLSKMLKDRRESMKGSDELKKKLNQLKDMKVKDGPADELAKAMQNGDFKEALKQIENLQRQMMDGKLNPEQMKKLANQMNQMQQKMQQMVKQHEQKKKELEQKIAQMKQQGNQQQAQKLQKKLNQMEAQNDAMKKMQQNGAEDGPDRQEHAAR